MCRRDAMAVSPRKPLASLPHAPPARVAGCGGALALVALWLWWLWLWWLRRMVAKWLPPTSRARRDRIDRMPPCSRAQSPLPVSRLPHSVAPDGLDATLSTARCHPLDTRSRPFKPSHARWPRETGGPRRWARPRRWAPPRTSMSLDLSSSASSRWTPRPTTEASCQRSLLGPLRRPRGPHRATTRGALAEFAARSARMLRPRAPPACSARALRPAGRPAHASKNLT